MDRKEQFEYMINNRTEMNLNIVKERLSKIWNYFDRMGNIDKRNLLKNVKNGQRLYRAPVSQYNGGKLLNRPLEQVIYMDEEFLKENPDIAMFQITHEVLHGVSLYRDGEQVVFGHHNTKGGSATNPYSGLNEAATQMFAEAVEGKRLTANEDYLYYIKNIMRAVTVLFGEEKVADQYLGNNINFENAFNQFSGNKFDYFAQIMNDIYGLERKRRNNSGVLNKEDSDTLKNYKENLNKFVAQMISIKQKSNPNTFDMVVDALQDETLSNELNPEQDKALINFAKKFNSSYRYLESDSDYEERVNSEESDIEYIAEYINRYNAGELNDLDIRSKIVNKETGKMKTRRIFQLLNAAKILSIGNQNYFETLCKSPEVKEILEQMMNTSFVQQIIENGEQTKKSNPNSKNPLTNGEKMNINAKKALDAKRREKLSKSGPDDDKLIFDSIIEIVQKGSSTTLGGFRKEDLDLARICCLQRGIKTVQKDFGGTYGLNVVEESIDPQKVKQDTILAGINISEINKKIKEIKDHVLNVVKGENVDMNR